MKAIKVDDETYKLLQELAEKYRLSIKEIASKSIKAYYTGMQYVPVDKEIKKIEDKIITLKYPTKCYKCGRELKQGELAYWQRYTYEDKSTKSRILCIKCYNDEKIADTTLAKLTIKEYQLKRKIEALNKHIKQLLSKAEDIQYMIDIYELKRKVKTLIEHLEQLFDNKEELGKIKEEIEELLEKLKEHEDFARTFILPKYIKKKAKVSETTTYRYRIHRG